MRRTFTLRYPTLQEQLSFVDCHGQEPEIILSKLPHGGFHGSVLCHTCGRHAGTLVSARTVEEALSFLAWKWDIL